MAEININDIIESGLDVEIGKINTEFKKLIDSIKGVTSSGVELNSTLKGTITTQQQVNNVNAQAATNANNLEKSTLKLTNLQTDYTKSIVALNKQKEKEIAAAEKAKKTTDAEAGSIDGLRYANKKLTEERNAVNLSTKEGREQAAKLNKQIESNTKIINDNGTAQEKQKANIGNYKSAFGGLIESFKAGEIGIGELIKGFAKLGVAMLANPIVLIIAAIVGALALLYKAFTKTDSGGTEMEARFKQISAILDVVMERVSLLAKGLVNLFKGNFKEAASQFNEAIKGTGEQLVNATKAAYEYVYALDALEDAEVSYISQKSKNENQIAKLEAAAADRTLSTEARKKALQDAIKLSEEEAKKAKEFATKRYDIELENVSKTRGISKQLLKDFIEADDEKAAQMLKSNKKLADVRDYLNNEGQKSLEEYYSKAIEADTKFFEENKRNISKLSGFENEINTEREAKRKEYAEKQKARLENLAKYSEELKNNEIAAMAEGRDKEEALAKKAFEDKKANYIKDVQDKALRDQLIIQAEDAMYMELTKIADKYRDEDSKKALETTLANAENQLNISVESFDSRLLALKKMYAEGAITEKEFNSKSKETALDLARAQIQILKDLADNTNTTEEAKLELKKQIAEKEKELNDSVLEQQIENNQKALEDSKKTETQKLEDKKATAQAVNEIIGASFDLFAAINDRELADLDKKKESELALVGDNEAAKAAIEKKYAAESASIKRRQAIADKAQALFKIGIDTAKAIVAALPNVPLSILMGVLGGIQAAAVIATPIPQFDKGTKSLPELSEVAERRPEFVVKNGKAELFTKPTILGAGYAGAEVISGAQTAQILNSGLKLSLLKANAITNGRDVTAEKLDAIISALNKGERVEVNIDRRGISTIYNRNREKINRIDKYIS